MLASSDLHPGNIIFADMTTVPQSDTDLMTSIGKPETGDVMVTWGYSLTPQVPKYLVSPTSVPSPALDARSCLVKIVDFGEAFMGGQERRTRGPLVFRAPEAILTTQRDLQADIWSLGCTVCASYAAFQDLLLIGVKDIRADRRIPSFQ